MKTYCVSCKKNTVNKNYSFRRTKQNRLMLVSNYIICGVKKSRSKWIIEQIRYQNSIK